MNLIQRLTKLLFIHFIGTVGGCGGWKRWTALLHQSRRRRKKFPPALAALGVEAEIDFYPFTNWLLPPLGTFWSFGLFCRQTTSFLPQFSAAKKNLFTLTVLSPSNFATEEMGCWAFFEEIVHSFKFKELLWRLWTVELNKLWGKRMTVIAITQYPDSNQSTSDEKHLSKSVNRGGALTIGCSHCQKVPLGSTSPTRGHRWEIVKAERWGFQWGESSS